MALAIQTVLIPMPLSVIIFIMNKTDLPITALKPTFHEAITGTPVVIVAPTGSGKINTNPALVCRAIRCPVAGRRTAARRMSFTRTMGGTTTR